MVDIIQPTGNEMANLETIRKLAAAKATSDWLDVFQETVEVGINTSTNVDALEKIQAWRRDWKAVKVELSAIGLTVLDEVDIENSPVAIPYAPRYIPSKPTKIWFYADGGKEQSITFSGVQARIATNFFVWMSSFQDTLQVAKQNRASQEEGGIFRAGLTIEAKQQASDAAEAAAAKRILQ